VNAHEQIEARFLSEPQLHVPLLHMFAPGVYVRTVRMPKGSYILGHEHTTKHFNFVLSGSATVKIGNETKLMVAPFIFTSEAGVRKELLIHEDMVWATVHPTDETDLEVLEKQLIVPTNAARLVINSTSRAASGFAIPFDVNWSIIEAFM